MTHACYACILVGEFPLQAQTRLQPGWQGKPAVVLEGTPPLEQVCSLNRAARSLGVAPGMTRLEMEMFPAALVLQRSYDEEEVARSALLACAGRFSPRVEELSTSHCFTCVIDIAGTEKLFGSPQTMAERLLKEIQVLQLQASIAVSSNFQAAICLARGLSFGRGASKNVYVAPNGKEGAALAPLPLDVLALSLEHAETFSSWGITTLGSLAALNEAELIARLGQAGKELRQLARGESPHLFLSLEPGLALEEQMELDAPVELLDSLLFMIGVTLDALIARAQAHMVALAAITLHLDLEGGKVYTRTVRPALPNCDRKLWLKLIHLDMQAHPPEAAILGLKLKALPGSTSKVQLGLFSPQTPEPMRLDVTLARIRNIVGEGCVGQPVLQDTHRPDAFRIDPFAVSATAASSMKDTVNRERLAMRQLRPPERVFVTVNDRQPKSFVFREKLYSVERAYGPWTSGGDWWKPTLWSFEQWDLVARAHDAAWLCCCLTRDVTQDCWQVEALYD